MIYIKFKKGQGLGNQLWLYASGLSIAEKLNQSFQVLNYENFKAKNFLEIKKFQSSKLNDENSLRQLRNSNEGEIDIFHESLYFDANLKFIASTYDERVINLKKDVLLEGLFQSENYFFNDLTKLKRYIKLSKSSIQKYSIPSDICVMNIRGGEYKRHKKLILKKNYWIQAMKNFSKLEKIKNFIIVTDDYRYCKQLFPEIEIISDDIEKCYATIYNCSNIIVSNSSFAYFPCKTGTPKKVIAPKYWARHYTETIWSSPCNIYEGWNWQDKNGSLSTYEECLSITKKSTKYFEDNFFYLVKNESIPKFSPVYFLPKQIKKLLKSILSYFFPIHFG